MVASLEDIATWLKEGEIKKDVSHMVVVCDTFDWEDYPVYVKINESIQKVYDGFNGKNMQKVMEVYSYNHNLEEQLKEQRAFHFD